ncbi:Carboxylesterase, type B [Penicillium occitanis (nom. inval.)]|nr:Carboxylesterase, type B [Penicillium occitanis (nom. inval.)]PCG99313.1 hypothetical protein PENOC_058680 [Penicillium occitanis (nom. inval.)]
MLLLQNMLLAFSAIAFASPSVTIDAGTLQGGQCENGKNANYYKGIPYAEAPLGQLRFEPPKAYGKYPNGTLNATTPATSCIQFGKAFLPGGAYSEDCLYVDVWTPSEATKDSKLPVKVWVYGGSNTEGGISDPIYNGCTIADEGAILVSINYRLGPIGFLGLDSAGIYGNQGIQDILLALEWVQNNVAAFGGDTKKVVLIGQSAGAEDAFIIATLPQAPSLFRAAISESIPNTQLMFNSTIQSSGASYAQALNCSVSDKTCLQDKTVAELRDAYSNNAYLNEGIGKDDEIGMRFPTSHGFDAYVDGTVIAEDPSVRGPQVPMIIGFNQKEGVLDTASQYPGIQAIESATAAQYQTFLSDDFGAAAQLVGDYYPLSLFQASVGNSTGWAVFEAISTVLTDAHFKCPGYQGLLEAARKNISVWTYEFTHNSSCVWMDTMEQSAISVYGATHTAELPYLFGNLDFDFNTSCNSTPTEYSLGKQMRKLWTAMAENGNPSTDDVQWPRFEVTANGSSTPGLIIGNSTVPGLIDYSVCQLWAKVNATILSSNATATGRPTASSTSLSTNGAGNITGTKACAVFSGMLMVLAVFV